MLFRCSRFQIVQDDYGLTCVGFNKLCYLDNPFVIASQVKQVFHIEDPIEMGLHYANDCPNIEKGFKRFMRLPRGRLSKY